MKKFLLSLFILLNCVLFSVAVFAEEKSGLKIGDADLSGNINIKDATLIQKNVAGLAFLEGDALELADADGNRTVNVKDATLIQKFVAGIVTEFPERDNAADATTQSSDTSVTSPTTQSSESATPTETTQPSEITTQTETESTTPSEPTTETPTEPITKPSVDSDGYFDTVIRP